LTGGRRRTLFLIKKKRKRTESENRRSQHCPTIRPAICDSSEIRWLSVRKIEFKFLKRRKGGHVEETCCEPGKKSSLSTRQKLGTIGRRGKKGIVKAGPNLSMEGLDLKGGEQGEKKRRKQLTRGLDVRKGNVLSPQENTWKGERSHLSDPQNTHPPPPPPQPKPHHPQKKTPNPPPKTHQPTNPTTKKPHHPKNPNKNLNSRTVLPAICANCGGGVGGGGGLTGGKAWEM